MLYRAWWCVYYALVVAQLAANAGAVPAPQLRTRSGLVEGLYDSSGKIETFKGIPFAQPPVGELRWRVPHKEKPWQDVRLAKKFSSACMQSRNGLVDLPPLPLSEDCLYLNVYRRYTPKGEPSGAALPIMLFFHGGSYKYGTAGFFLYDASNLVRHAQENVIIVSANYVSRDPLQVCNER